MPIDLTRWTIRLAMIAYVAALAMLLREWSIARRRRTGDTHNRNSTEATSATSPCLPLSLSPCLEATQSDLPQRTLWSLACLLTWAHVLCAFAVHHHWSHAEAYTHTALETGRKVGIAWGGGIYFNYLFLALWTADAIWWWWKPASYRARSRSIATFVHAYLAFIAFNATVVFGPGPVRYAGVAAILLLALAAITLRGHGPQTVMADEREAPSGSKA